MLLRLLFGLILLSITQVRAGDLKPDEARRLIAGKWWSFRCSEGTTGFGRILANGSVSGEIKHPRSAAVWHSLPSQTVVLRSDSICASVPFGSSTLYPCFSFNKIDARRLRGNVSSPWWMWALWGKRYCDFVPQESQEDS